MKATIKPVGNGSFNVYRDDVLYARDLVHSEAVTVRKSLIDDTALELIPLEPWEKVRDYG